MTNEFIEYQRFNCEHPTDIDHSFINGKDFLFVANGNVAAPSSIFTLNEKTNFFELFQEIQSTTSASDVEAFSIGTRQYLAVANHMDGTGTKKTHTAGSDVWKPSNFIYEMNPQTEKYVPVHRWPEKRAVRVRHFKLGDQHFIASAALENHQVVVYKLGDFAKVEQKGIPGSCSGVSIATGTNTAATVASLQHVNIAGTLCIDVKKAPDDAIAASKSIVLTASVVGAIKTPDHYSFSKMSRIQKELPAGNTTWYVDSTSGRGDDNTVEGRLKAQPLLTIQEGVNRANQNDTVRLMRGIFLTTASSFHHCASKNPKKRRCNSQIDIQGKPITVQGEGPLASDVIIDCGFPNAISSSIDDWTSSPVRAFVFVSGETSKTRVEMLTIRNCRAHAGVDSRNGWRTPTCIRGTPFATSSNVFRFSRGLFETVPAHAGGGIAAVGKVYPVLQDLVIDRCRAGKGGGMFLGAESGVTMIRVDVKNCESAGGPAASLIQTSSKTEWRGGTITNNKATSGVHMGAFESCLESIDVDKLEVYPPVISPVDQFRSIVPHPARRSHYFELNGLSLLAVAAETVGGEPSDGSSGPPIKETIVYQINNDASTTGIDTTQALSPIVWQSFPKAFRTKGGLLTKSETHGCIKTFTINGKGNRLRHFLIIGLLQTYGYLSGTSGSAKNNKHVNSRLYEYMGPEDKFVMVQKIDTMHVVDIQYMNINGDNYLAFAQQNSPDYHGNLWMPLWKHDPATDSWLRVMYKEILTQDAFGLEYFQIGGDHYLIVCNGNRPTMAPSAGLGIKDETNTWVVGPDEASFVLKWNAEVGKFEKYQNLKTSGAHSAAYFAKNGKHYLAVANYRNDYHINDVSGQHCVTIDQPFPCNLNSYIAARPLASSCTDDNPSTSCYSPTDRYRRQTYEIFSQIYELDPTTNKWKLYFNISTFGGFDVEHFKIGPDDYLVFVNRGGIFGYDTDLDTRANGEPEPHLYKFNQDAHTFNLVATIPRLMTADNLVGMKAQGGREGKNKHWNHRGDNDIEFFQMGGRGFVSIAETVCCSWARFRIVKLGDFLNVGRNPQAGTHTMQISTGSVTLEGIEFAQGGGEFTKYGIDGFQDFGQTGNSNSILRKVTFAHVNCLHVQGGTYSYVDSTPTSSHGKYSAATVLTCSDNVCPSNTQCVNASMDPNNNEAFLSTTKCYGCQIPEPGMPYSCESTIKTAL